MRCVPREKFRKIGTKIARDRVGFCRVFARCTRAVSAPEVLLDVLEMICGIIAVLECDLRLFAGSFGAELRWIRSEIESSVVVNSHE